MMKNFDLQNELNLHYLNTFFTIEKLETGTKEIAHLHSVERVNMLAAFLHCKTLNKSGSWLTRKYYYQVRDDDETNQIQLENGTDSSKVKIDLSYPVKKCVNTDKDTYIVYKLPKRQWLWGFCNGNSKVLSFSKIDNVYIGSETNDLLKSVFFKQQVSFVKEVENILSKKKISAAVNDYIIINKYKGTRKKYLFNLYYKEHRIGVVDTNLTAITSASLKHLKSKLSVFPKTIFK